MADPIIINPKLTTAGQAAAFTADNNGLDLKITHVSFGLAHYNPTGSEKALKSPIGSKVAVAGASRPTPNQIRMISTWREDVGYVGIGEIAWWSDDVLVFIWSKADGTVAAYKTDGVAYVLFNDLQFAAVPPNSISFKVDPNESVALAAIAAHEGANNAHPQYTLRAKFPDYQGHLWGDTGGTANAITLSLPAIVELTQYIKGNRFTFKAKTTNTGAVTININGVGAVEVLKTGGVPCTAGSIQAGGVYDVYHDGSKFQLTAGAGFASAEATEEEVTGTEATTSTSWVSVRRLLQALSGVRQGLTALAAALLGIQLRSQLQQDQLDTQGEALRVAGTQQANLVERMGAAEQRQDSDRDAALGTMASNSAALVAEQLRGQLQQDQIDDLAGGSYRAASSIADLSRRMQVSELRQDVDHDSLAGAAINNATAVISGQMRDLQQQDQLDSLAESGRQAGSAIDNHTQRLRAAEDQIDSLSTTSRQNGVTVDNHAQRLQSAETRLQGAETRLTASEKRQDTDREALLGATVCNAAAIIALQTLVTKNTYGA